MFLSLPLSLPRIVYQKNMESSMTPSFMLGATDNNGLIWTFVMASFRYSEIKRKSQKSLWNLKRKSFGNKKKPRKKRKKEKNIRKKYPIRKKNCKLQIKKRKSRFYFFKQTIKYVYNHFSIVLFSFYYQRIKIVYCPRHYSIFIVCKILVINKRVIKK